MTFEVAIKVNPSISYSEFRVSFLLNFDFSIFIAMKVMLGAIPLVINDETMKAFMKQNQDNESTARKQVDHTAGFFEN